MADDRELISNTSAKSGGFRVRAYVADFPSGTEGRELQTEKRSEECKSRKTAVRIQQSATIMNSRAMVACLLYYMLGLSGKALPSGEWPGLAALGDLVVLVLWRCRGLRHNTRL